MSVRFPFLRFFLDLFATYGPDLADSIRAVTLRSLNLTGCLSITLEEIADLARIQEDVAILRYNEGYTDPAAPSLLPGFKPPPKAEQFWNGRRKWSNAALKKPTKGKKKAAKRK